MERIIYRVTRDFYPRLADELKLKENDLVELISNDSEFNDGWYIGKNLNTPNGENNVGLFPMICVELVDLSQLSTPNPSNQMNNNSSSYFTPNSNNSNNHNLNNNTANNSNNNNNNNNSHVQTPQGQLLRSRSRRITPTGSPIVTNTHAPPNNSNDNSSRNNSTNSINYSNSNATSPSLTRLSSVHRTMNDIDNALKELNVGDGSKNNQLNNNTLGLPFDPSTVESWTPEEVTQYFSFLGFDIEYAGKFVRHKISGAILIELELSYLKELDIDSFGTRFEIFKEIKELKKYAAAAAATHNTHGSPSTLNGSYSNSPTNNSNTGFSKTRNSIRINSPNSLNSRYSSMYSHSRKKSQSMDDLPIHNNNNNNNNNSYNDDSTTNTANSNNSYTTNNTSSNTIAQPGYKSLRPLSVAYSNSNNIFAPFLNSSSQTPINSPSLDRDPRTLEEEAEEGEGTSSEDLEFIDTKQDLTNVPTNEDALFESPRRAPQPPSFQSPLMNDNFKFGAGTSFKRDNSTTSTQKKRHSFIEATSKINNGHHSRNSSIGQSSSIYNNSHHARTNSSLSFVPSTTQKSGHFRNTSDASVIKHGNNNNNNNNNNNSTSTHENTHRRYSSLLSYSAAERENVYDSNTTTIANGLNRSPSRSPVRKSVAAQAATAAATKLSTGKNTILASPERRSISAKEISSPKISSPSKNRTVSAMLPSTSSNMNSNNNKNVTARKKSQTSAFTEGLRTISAKESMKTAEFSGWMAKRGNLTIGSWKKRFFTLHKTRLSYFTSLNDKAEKGLIDITSHRVLQAVETEDKISAVYAASTGSGRYCFKLIPPAPGSRKGLTFTQQKVHYFAVDTKEEMRAWMAALTKATIELDESVPVISSCVTPTIPLQKAQELAAKQKQIDLTNYDEKGELLQFDDDLDDNTFLSSVNKSLKLDTSNATISNVSNGSSTASTPLTLNTPTLSIKKSTTVTKNVVPMITKLDPKVNDRDDDSSLIGYDSNGEKIQTSNQANRSSSNGSALGSAVSLGKRVMSLRKA